jgi:hypothetical protein
MARKMTTPLRSLLLACSALVAAAGAAAAQERVGVAGAVNPATTGQPPGLPMRTLLVGNDVVFNEHIATAADGQAQLLFLDRSSFSIGPNSDILIDQFVYDKGAGTGKLVANATKGVFRFVGGALSKNDGQVQIRTPTATIGIRGGVVIAQIDPGGQTRATFLYGKEMTVTSGGQTQRVLRPGFQVEVPSRGTVTPPAPAPASSVAGAMGQLDGRPGAAGGAPRPPTPMQVAASGVPQNNSQDVQASSRDAQRNDASAPPPPPPPGSNPPPADRNAARETVANPPPAESHGCDFFQSASCLPFGDPVVFVDPVAVQRILTTLTANGYTPFSPTRPDLQTSLAEARALTGTFSYGGSATGGLTNGSTTVQAAGSAFLSYNLGAGSGIMTISGFTPLPPAPVGFGSFSVSGAVQSAVGATTPAFAGPVTSGSTSGFFTGQFFNNPAAGSNATAKEAVGNFGFTHPGNITGFGSFKVSR